MPGLLQRAAARVFGLTPPADVAALKGELNRAIRKISTSSGVAMTYGRFETEFNAALKGAKRWETLDKMEADPHVKGALRSNTLPLLTAEWEFQPASDKPRDVEIAEFCEASLLRKTSDRFGPEFWIQAPWRSQRLPEILSMLRDGFALFVPTYRKAGSKIVYDRLQWLEPSTIERWVLDDTDNLAGVVRNYDRQTNSGRNSRRVYEEFIPSASLKLYVWDMKGARYNGRSMVRSMYGPWFRKDFVQRMGTIWTQKVGSPVPIGLYPKGYSDDQRERFEEFVQSLRGEAPAEAWGAFEKASDGTGPDLKYVGAETGEIDRSSTLVRSENEEIGHAAGTSAGMLGETNSGTRSLGESKGLSEGVGIEAVAEVLAEQEAHGVGNIRGVIEDLVDLNFAGVRDYPRLIAPKMNIFERMQVATTLVLPAVSAGLIPNHPDLRRQITDMAGFSLPDDAFDVEPATRVPAPGDPGDPDNQRGPDPGSRGTPEDENDDEDEQESLAAGDARREAFRARIAPLLAPAREGAPVIGGGFRSATRLEAGAVNLAEIERVFEGGRRDVLQVLRSLRESMIGDLMGRLHGGKIERRNIESQRRSKYRGAKKAAAELEAVLRGVGLRGAAHVDDELAAQRPGAVAA